MDSSITGASTAKAAAILSVTLVLGVAIGAFGVGSLAQVRMQRLDDLRGPGGFVSHVQSVIEPRDEEQRAAILPFLEAIDERNREIIEAANEALGGTLEQLQADLSALLDTDQTRRLRDFGRRPPPGLGPGGGPSGRGGPPPPGGRRGRGDGQRGGPPRGPGGGRPPSG